MLKLGRIVSTALMVGVMLGALSGCQKKEGPAERAGKVVDQTAEKVGQQVEKAGENIQDAAKGDSKK